MENLKLSDRALDRYPFLNDIVKAANTLQPRHLVQVLEYCIFKIVLTENLEPQSQNIEFDKLTESVNAKVSEALKNRILRLAEARGIGASTFLRQAAEFYIDFLYKDVKPAKKQEREN